MTISELKAPIADTRFTWSDALGLHKIGTFANPSRDQALNIIRQAKELQKIYDLLGGFTITSWLRTPDYNKLIGGATHSAHLLGLATDFVPTNMTPDEARAKIKAAAIYPGRTELNASTWCHYDLTGDKDFFA